MGAVIIPVETPVIYDFAGGMPFSFFEKIHKPIHIA